MYFTFFFPCPFLLSATWGQESLFLLYSWHLVVCYRKSTQQSAAEWIEWCRPDELISALLLRPKSCFDKFPSISAPLGLVLFFSDVGPDLEFLPGSVFHCLLTEFSLISISWIPECFYFWRSQPCIVLAHGINDHWSFHLVKKSFFHCLIYGPRIMYIPGTKRWRGQISGCSYCLNTFFCPSS